MAGRTQRHNLGLMSTADADIGRLASSSETVCRVSQLTGIRLFLRSNFEQLAKEREAL